MEMNTRLQVEHPVTEMISGLDLVELQLRVAAGQKLVLVQSELKPRGHAVEVRLYAEDPAQDFLPSTGLLKHFAYPTQLAGVRVDTGFVSGDQISLHYDPMMAKVIAWAATREAAIDRLRNALAQVEIAGVKHNNSFLHKVLDIPAFKAGELSTRFLEQHQAQWSGKSAPATAEILAAALFFQAESSQQARPRNSQDRYSPWHMSTAWRLEGHAAQIIKLQQAGQMHTVAVREQANGQHAFSYENAQGDIRLERQAGKLVLDYQGRQHRYAYFYDGHTLSLYSPGTHGEWQLAQQDFDPSHSQGSGHYQAPMNGRIAAVLVQAGQTVASGDTLLIMEAMKMEHRIRAHSSGKITALLAAPGDLASEGQVLLELEADSE